MVVDGVIVLVQFTAGSPAVPTTVAVLGVGAVLVVPVVPVVVTGLVGPGAVVVRGVVAVGLRLTFNVTETRALFLKRLPAFGLVAFTISACLFFAFGRLTLPSPQ